MNSGLWLERAAMDMWYLDAELLLASAIGEDRINLRTHPERELTEDEERRADEAFWRRMSGEPVAYIVGWKEFYGWRFAVNADVLIPRPETEALVEAVVEMQPRRLLDVGTGSGCIAVSAALELPGAEVVATDVSEGALVVARQNAKNLMVGKRVKFLQADLLNFGVGEVGGKFDVIVANLPYVYDGWEWNSPELAFEPKLALFGGADGLELYRKMVRDVPKYLKRGGALVVEADECQHERMLEFTKACGLELELVWGIGMVFRLI